jgi:chromosome segregation ATPase
MDASIIVAAVAAFGAAGSTVVSVRGSRAQARETAASTERLEQEKLRREEINQLRASLEGIIIRLSADVDSTRSEMLRVREQLDREEAVSDGLRARVHELEEKLHRTNLSMIELQRQLAGVMSTGAPLGREAGALEER